MNSIDYPPPSPFICPALRTKGTNGSWSPDKKRWFQSKKIGETTYLIINNSFHLSDAEDENFSNSRNSYHISYVGDKKVLNSHHLRLFLGCNNKEGEQNDFYCKACDSYKIGTTYYYCNDCNNPYHKECVESPPTFISPYHPKYPLQLLIIWDEGSSKEECHYCGIKIWGLVYYSFTCGLFLHPVCAGKREFSVINNPKRHEHILHYFPRKASLTCDVCASDDNKRCFYSCLQCDFIVHRRCIDLSRVILISCHSHRLSFANSLPSGNWSCGVCRQKIDENYGSYSCTKRCTYAVHTNCATLLDVWAGEELEDQPETEYDDLKPSFEEIGDGIRRHFSHPHHHLRLIEDIEMAYDAKQQYCQACILPLYDGNVYSCMKCDFVLHETCANLPRIKRIGVHRHPLVLKLIPAERFFCCYLCDRYSCGFVYMCIRKGCPSNFCVDVRCASLSELADHPSHPHPLFLFYERGIYQKCSTCETLSYRSLNCVECDFLLCVRCANLPYKVKYEQDEHILTFSYEKNATNPYWCQVCEETAAPKKGYYRCNECGVTFHIECILGNDFYMKTGEFLTSYEKVEIILNDRLSRPICKTCKRRCQYNIVFKTSDGHIFCSIEDLKASQPLMLLPIKYLTFLEV